MQGRHVGSSDVDARNHEEAARLQAAVADASAGTTATPAPPTPNLAQLALEKRKQEVWDLAQDQGVEVASDVIAQMDEATLEEWATTNLI